MDGTLLDAEGRVPDGLWPLLRIMAERGIAFAPASGRQYATLRDAFDQVSEGMPFIAENGSFVVRDDVELSSTPVDPEIVERVLAAADDATAAGRDVGVVLCARRCGYVSRADDAFMAQVRKYYHSHAVVDDLRAVDDAPIKMALFDFDDAETGIAPALSEVADTHQVVVSGAHWVDVMQPGVNKGTALRALQSEMGITAAQTAAFGDYLNDLEMLREADLSFAMANAHPDIRAVARFTAPSHTEAGVVAVLERLLGV